MDFAAQLFEFKKNRNYKQLATNWLISGMKKPYAKMPAVSPQYLRLGGLYFMRYDLSGINKTTKMEQFSPIVMVDYKPMLDSRVIYGLNLNFLTTQKKEAFFSSYFSGQESVIESNSEQKDWFAEKPFEGVNYKSMYTALLSYGFDYAIREYRVELINNLHGISTDDTAKLISINTQALTGVDEAAINNIWIAKLKKEGIKERMNDILTIKNNYEKIIEELDEKFKHLNKRLQ